MAGRSWEEFARRLIVMVYGDFPGLGPQLAMGTIESGPDDRRTIIAH